MKLSITYKIISSDTFETIARKVYGSEIESIRITNANPGVVEPLTVGTIITIPDLPGTPVILQQQSDSNNPDETTLLIDGKRFRFWDKIRIFQQMDSISIVEFSAPFDSTLQDFKNIFKPFSYKAAVVSVGGFPIFTGAMISVLPVVENNQKLINVSCYSKPGVLNDCTAPASLYPLEFKNQGLREISKKLAGPFGVNVIFEDNKDPPFEPTVACDTDKKILPFLAGLAKQRGLIMSNDSRGNLIIHKSVSTRNPVSKLEQGFSPLLSIAPSFDPQQYYSHITGIDPVSVGLDGSQYTVKNPHIEGVLRPLTFVAPDTEGSNLKSAVEAKMGRMFGNLVSYNIKVSTWRDSNGELWHDNTTILLLAPDAMIYNQYEFTIRTVVFESDEGVKTATLNLVIPESFADKIPESLPWDE